MIQKVEVNEVHQEKQSLHVEIPLQHLEVVIW